MLSRYTLSLAALLASTLPALAADSGYREFKAWQVSCGQTLSCGMRQYISGSAVSGFELRRSGAPEAPVVLILSPDDSNILEGDGELGVTIAIDDGQTVAMSGDAITASVEAGTLELAGDFIANGLISALKDGTTATIAITRGATSVQGEVPLAGAAASLLFIDEYQKRVGHVDAMSAKGDKAPNPAPPISDVRRLSDFPEGVRVRFAAGGECGETEETMLDGNALAHKLFDELTLYVTPCGMGGAYNMPYAVFVDSYGTVSTLAFPMMRDGAPSAATVAYNLAYDYETGLFSAFFRGRGIGDCGTYSEWKLSEGGVGPQLLLVTETFRDCPEEVDENEEIDPANWAKAWPLN
ncbi:DUF1176 domain-containing protein [Ciceribacter sp. L1K23]|uniref:DUF1176 domain-containing protein n=1 Tax=Ciceribacter sp. L1K23 TaxID=2820276 RepID=UPI001B812146|nr:DUF1176 domain-containing protein [Ciceribacter sp. L1K23]MBR0557235.1 DUF1176 domain-containing protein [Ciceribacter sp. L1K23]